MRDHCVHRATVSSLLSRLLVLVLVLSLTPGLVELVENAWHLMEVGHVAHAVDQGADHQPEGDEHGCSGNFHVCSCHHTPPSHLARLGLGTDHDGRRDRARRGHPPHLHDRAPQGVFRPPRTSFSS